MQILYAAAWVVVQILHTAAWVVVQILYAAARVRVQSLHAAAWVRVESLAAAALPKSLLSCSCSLLLHPQGGVGEFGEFVSGVCVWWGRFQTQENSYTTKTQIQGSGK